jgi:hypothetical protein
LDRIAGQTQRLDRQRAQGVHLAAGRNDPQSLLYRSMMRHGPGGADGVGNRGNRPIAATLQSSEQWAVSSGQ